MNNELVSKTLKPLLISKNEKAIFALSSAV